MPIAYEKAKQRVVDLLGDVMSEHHPELAACEVTVDILMVSSHDKEGSRLPDAVKLHGYPCLATMKIVPLKQRVLGQADALLSIDELAWEDLSEEQQVAALDHELEHIEVVDEDGGFVSVDPDTSEMIGTPKSDDIGRPVLKLKLHDWQLGGFRNVAKRHGIHAIEVQQADECRDENGQYFWDWEKIKPVRAFERQADVG